ncbi:MAG: sulfide/dihydroorotate dehydrogenase-like FAD/NAD-binding protein [Ignavibacteriae bacterium]|nr:sulfide/dihydroorotate dehydrogenase-like FAD/NAD-binding protein [Ignavibacteriota bacterium]
MAKILHKEKLSENVYKMKLEAKLIAEERKAGQFIILQIDEDFGERIPLTIADANVNEGSITIIFQVVGLTTDELSKLNVGDDIPVLVGPLGTPTHIKKHGTVVCVGGGIGVAPLHPIAEALKAAGNTVIIIIGARNKELIIMEDEMKKIADELIVCTDDGSYGRKSLVTQPLKEICERNEKPDFVIAIGPPIMMKFCAETTRPYNVYTEVSLNTIMVDGTGMCGGCRVNVGGEVKFVCVDGPEFDGHKVDFDNMMARLNSYKEIEHDKHSCYLDSMIQEKSL